MDIDAMNRELNRPLTYKEHLMVAGISDEVLAEMTEEQCEDVYDYMNAPKV